jgi:hypothetical protein
MRLVRLAGLPLQRHGGYPAGGFELLVFNRHGHIAIRLDALAPETVLDGHVLELDRLTFCHCFGCHVFYPLLQMCCQAFCSCC